MVGHMVCPFTINIESQNCLVHEGGKKEEVGRASMISGIKHNEKQIYNALATMSAVETKVTCLRQCPPDSALSAVEDLVDIIQQCKVEKNGPLALFLHAHLCEIGLDSQTTLANSLVSLLSHVDRADLAQQIFDKLVYKSESSWSSLILGCYNRGQLQQSLLLYRKMLETGRFCVNVYAVVALMMSCGTLSDIETGRVIFMEVARQGLLDKNIFVASTLVHMYANFQEIELAQEIFHKLSIRNVVSWNVLISCYTDHGFSEEALSCLQEMELDGFAPDAVSLVCGLKACGTLGNLSKGESIHGEIIRKGLLEDSFFVCSGLVNMYIRCQALNTACIIFKKIPMHNTITWNAMISGYAECSWGEESINCFEQMQNEGFSPDDVTFISILKSCSKLGCITTGYRIHCDILLIGLENNTLIGGGLVDMYSKCGSLSEAEEILTKLPVRDTVIWTALILGHMDYGESINVLRIFGQIRSDNVAPGIVTLYCVLKACSKEGDRFLGVQLHNEAVLKGLETESVLSGTLVSFYAKCVLLEEAQKVFSIHSSHDVFCQSALLVGFIEQGLSKQALETYKHLQGESAASDVAILVCALKACGTIGAVDDGQKIHADICRRGFESEPFVCSTLVDMYAKCGVFVDAEKASDKMIDSCNAFISGFLQYGHEEEALNCTKQWVREGFSPDLLTFIFSLNACCNLGATRDGQIVHSEAIKKGLEVNLLISNTLVDLYVKCGLFAEAFNVFRRCSSQTAVLWTTMIAGCIEHGHNEQAFHLFDQMQLAGMPPSNATFSCMLRVCKRARAMGKGVDILTDIVKRGMLETSMSLCSTVIDMFSKQGDLMQAENVFSKLPIQDVISWTVLIAGYIEHGFFKTALIMFEQMQHINLVPFVVTFTSILKCCGCIGALNNGRRIHSEVVKRGIDIEPNVGNTIVDMYAKCGLLSDAKKMIDTLPAWNVGSWTALIKGYMESDKIEEAFLSFEHMEEENLAQDLSAFVEKLKACTIMAILGRGQDVHAEILKRGFDGDTLIGNALVDLYAKSGLLFEAEDIFCRLSGKDVVSWTSLLVGYSQAGMSDNAVYLFDSMVRCHVKPDPTAFLAVFSAFSHSGLVETGQMCFEKACNIHGFIPSLEHYTCLVDLLGRAGHVDKAVKLVMEIPVHPGLTVWLTILGACRKSGNLKFGRDAFNHAKALNDYDSAAYVSLANMYAECRDSDGDERFVDLKDSDMT